MQKFKLTTSWESLLHDKSQWSGSHCGNWADDKLCAPYTCCGPMELHDDVDYGVTPEAPYFYIQPLYWDEDLVLVATDDSDEFYIIERTGEPLMFNGTKPHGLMPLDVAQELVTTQSTEGPMYKTFEFMVSGIQVRTKPMMVWKWLTKEDFETMNKETSKQEAQVAA
jgi:hypothetical protein